MSRGRKFTRITVVLKKRIDLPLTFVLENRAGAVKQHTRWRQLRPQVLQETRLHFKKPWNVIGSPEPPDIGVPSDDPRRTAWRVQQNGLV